MICHVIGCQLICHMTLLKDNFKAEGYKSAFSWIYKSDKICCIGPTLKYSKIFEIKDVFVNKTLIVLIDIYWNGFHLLNILRNSIYTILICIDIAVKGDSLSNRDCDTIILSSLLIQLKEIFVVGLIDSHIFFSKFMKFFLLFLILYLCLCQLLFNFLILLLILYLFLFFLF
jgi:hypothetical protein